MTTEFKPKIIGFLCRWCSYTGADLAGTSRSTYPASLTAIRVMCSGRVDPLFVVNAFANGADGVLIAGCHPGDCHYQVGNYRTMRRTYLLCRMIEQFGIDSRRLKLAWVSASEGDRFAKLVREFTGVVKELGPLAWQTSIRALCEPA